jgi:hypothetical protein
MKEMELIYRSDITESKEQFFVFKGDFVHLQMTRAATQPGLEDEVIEIILTKKEAVELGDLLWSL